MSVPNSGILPASQIIRGDLASQIDAFMSDHEQNGFSGALLIEQNGEIILASGYGYANRAAEIPNTTETVFDIGSVTKQFTGAAILKLVEQGKVQIDDPIAKYFEAVPADKAAITLHQLLTHTAGFKSDLADDYDPILRAEYMDLALNSKLDFEPGEKHSYSNAGYSLLAAIIEIVTGDSYEAYLRANLLEPSGMTQTGYLLPEWDIAQLAHGYGGILFQSKDQGTPLDYPFAEDGPYWNLRGNGGILSTAQDMYRWHKALEGDQILSAESKVNLFAPHVHEGFKEESYYGYGWVNIPTSRGTTLITHNGGNGIFFADMLRYVDESIMILIVSNAGKPNATELSWQIAEMIFE